MMQYCEIPEHKELVESWDRYYPCPEGKSRMGMVLHSPSFAIKSLSAISHDFYYYSDEFSILFEPLRSENKLFLLIEGEHEKPMHQRVPILSTWTHLRRLPWGERGIQETFVFYDNLWWTVDQDLWRYDHSKIDFREGVDNTPYSPRAWCHCNKNAWITSGVAKITTEDGLHQIYHQIYSKYTLFYDKQKDPVLSLLAEDYLKNPIDGFYLDVLADYYCDKGDSFGDYLRDSHKEVIARYRYSELKHVLEFIKLAKNDRSVKLILLADVIMRCSGK